jgi:hypothetical protein
MRMWSRLLDVRIRSRDRLVLGVDDEAIVHPECSEVELKT